MRLPELLLSLGRLVEEELLLQPEDLEEELLPQPDELGDVALDEPLELLEEGEKREELPQPPRLDEELGAPQPDEEEDEEDDREEPKPLELELLELLKELRPLLLLPELREPPLLVPRAHRSAGRIKAKTTARTDKARLKKDRNFLREDRAFMRRWRERAGSRRR